MRESGAAIKLFSRSTLGQPELAKKRLSELSAPNIVSQKPVWYDATVRHNALARTAAASIADAPIFSTQPNISLLLRLSSPLKTPQICPSPPQSRSLPLRSITKIMKTRPSSQTTKQATSKQVQAKAFKSHSTSHQPSTTGSMSKKFYKLKTCLLELFSCRFKTENCLSG